MPILAPLLSSRKNGAAYRERLAAFRRLTVVAKSDEPREPNKLYFGDNLHWLEKMADGSVDLV